MQKLRLLFAIVVLAMLPNVLQAQNNTNSPYTRYAYGKLADQAFGAQRAMGGIGIGLYDSQKINPLNPASFSSIDSMTFMFDVGLTGQFSRFEYNGAKSNKFNGNLEYIAMQFPLAKGLGMGIGFAPITYVGYNYGDSVRTAVTETKGYQIYQGRGGLQKVYGTVSYKLFDRLSLGANVGYLFGDVMNTKSQSFEDSKNISSIYADTIRASGLVYEAGLQYIQPIGKDKSLAFGVVYAPKTKISGVVRQGILRVNSSTSVVESGDYPVSRDSVFEMPEKIGFGMTYNRKNHYTIGADVQMQQWADARFFNKTDSLSNTLKVNFGGEYTPSYKSNKFFKRITYRAGAYYSDSYSKVNVAGTDYGYKEYGVSLGFGFPSASYMGDRRSQFNLSFDYTTIRPEKKNVGLISEQYFKVTVSYTFNELWFFKRKVQ